MIAQLPGQLVKHYYYYSTFEDMTLYNSLWKVQNKLEQQMWKILEIKKGVLKSILASQLIIF